MVLSELTCPSWYSDLRSLCFPIFYKSVLYIWYDVVFINNLIFAISTSMWGDYYVGIMLCAPSLMSPICLSCKTNTHRRFSIWTFFIEIYLHPLSHPIDFSSIFNICMNSSYIPFKVPYIILEIYVISLSMYMWYVFVFILGICLPVCLHATNDSFYEGRCPMVFTKTALLH